MKAIQTVIPEEIYNKAMNLVKQGWYRDEDNTPWNHVQKRHLNRFNCSLLSTIIFPCTNILTSECRDKDANISLAHTDLPTCECRDKDAETFRACTKILTCECRDKDAEISPARTDLATGECRFKDAETSPALLICRPAKL